MYNSLIKSIVFVLLVIVGIGLNQLTAQTNSLKNIEFKILLDRSLVFATKNSDSTILFANKALKIARELKDSNLVAKVYLNKSTYRIRKGDFALAEELSIEAINIVDSMSNPSALAMAYNNLGAINKKRVQYNEALKYYLNSLRINQQLKDTQKIFNIHLNIGGLYSSMENYPKSLEYYMLANKLSDNISNKTKGNLYNGIAITLKNLGKYNKSLSYYYKALALYRVLDWSYAIAYVYGNIGVLYSDLLNSPDSALFYYNAALKIHEQISNDYGIGINKINLALVYTKINNYDKAEKLFIQSIDIANQIGSTKLLQYAYSDMSDMYEKSKKYKQAYQYYKLNRVIFDSVLTVKKHKQLTELETKYQTTQKEKEIEILQKDNEIKDAKVKAQHRLILLIAIAFLLIFIIAYFYYRLNKNKQKTIQNELQIKNLLTEQKMLRSQMNPHFIFNSLNSIQSFISAGKAYDAEKYLARFGKLMRGILENSRADYITLENEVEVLQLYIGLEQLRFDNRFEFSIEMDDDLECELIMIPAMLIQPFCENAILHAFKNRKNGKLKLSFADEGDILVCTIDDNGIGRKATQESKTENKHTSLATQITIERLATLSEQMNVNASLSITDKVDKATDMAIGTKVELRIPIIAE